MDICLANTPFLQNVSTSIAALPYLPEALWLHEVIGPVIFDFSLTETNLNFEKTQYGTIQMLVQQWVRQLQASEGDLLTDTELWKALLEFTNEDLESIVRMLPRWVFSSNLLIGDKDLGCSQWAVGPG